MKQITNKEYIKYEEYKRARANGEILMPDGLRFMCESEGWDAEQIGKNLIDALMKIEARKVRSRPT